MKIINVINSPKKYLIIAKSRLLNRYRVYRYKGENVLCEICGWRGNNFFNGKCPKCNSLPRTRLIPYSLKYFEFLNKKLDILHIAPNKIEYNTIKNKISNYKIYDRLDVIKRDLININQDITKSTISDCVYDLVIAWHVFEHIEDDMKAISEVYRILKPNGKFLMSVPIYPNNNKVTYEDRKIEYKDFEKIHGHPDHCRSCGFDYFKRFEKAGFKTETLNVVNENEKPINHLGLSKNHLVWCFTK